MKTKTAKAKATAKVAKPASKSVKGASKPATKPAKTAVKPLAKSSAKSSVKSAKAPLKSVAKSAKSAIAKSVGKKLATKKTAAKKPAVKTATAKQLTPATKSAKAKAALKPVAKAPTKAALKPSAKTPAKVPAKTPAKKTAAAKTASAPRAKDSPVSKTKKVSMPSSSVSVPAKPVVKPPAKPPRKSRLEQLTVPSMAQSVASTAAKASYGPIADLPIQVMPVYVAAKKDSKLANNWKHKAPEELSDAEVLAMPDSEYMNQAQTAFFRSRLVKLREAMLSNAGETTIHLREETVIVPDPADRATIEEEHALELRTRDRERKLLKKVAQSIIRIDAGDYGYCDETGEAIGVGRLLARPTATLSLEAQQRRELKQKMFGD